MTRRGDATALAAREELARRRLAPFIGLMDPTYVSTPHTRLICEHLEALERGDIGRLMIFLPPRHGKTMHLSEAFPAWALGRDPKRQFVLASYGAELAEKNSRKARSYMQAERWPFECKLSEESFAANRWNTTNGGICIAAGVGGALTGFGADFPIIDDPVRGREEAESDAYKVRAREWFQDVARTRLMPNGRICLAMTRWSDGDLAGDILESDDAKNWTVLTLPAVAEENDPLGRNPGEALWPERFPVSALPSVERGEMSSRSFAALYQQSPVPTEGNLIRREWLRYVDAMPTEFESLVFALDAAAKTGIANDFTALAIVGVSKTAYYLVDMIRRKVEFPDLRRLLVGAFEKHKPSRIYIEDTSNATALLQELRRESRLPVVPVQAKGSKISRVEGITGIIESGRLHLPTNAPWLAEFERELLGFPGARHDDMVDALVIALTQLRRTHAASSWSFSVHSP